MNDHQRTHLDVSVVFEAQRRIARNIEEQQVTASNSDGMDRCDRALGNRSLDALRAGAVMQWLKDFWERVRKWFWPKPSD
jgi:hypothetical protein